MIAGAGPKTKMERAQKRADWEAKVASRRELFQDTLVTDDKLRRVKKVNLENHFFE